MPVLDTLDRTIPFAFLDPGRRAWIASRVQLRHLEPRMSAITDADRAAGSAFVVARGSLEVHDAQGRPTIPEGQYFGELGYLLDAAHPDARAGELGADLLVISGQDFLALVDESSVFAQALASILVRKLKVFDGYRAFH